MGQCKRITISSCDYHSVLQSAGVEIVSQHRSYQNNTVIILKRPLVKMLQCDLEHLKGFGFSFFFFFPDLEQRHTD